MTAMTQNDQRRTGRMKAHVVRGGGGLRLHVREWGPADGPAILLIHGWSENHLCWARQYESALVGEFGCRLRSARSRDVRGPARARALYRRQALGR